MTIENRDAVKPGAKVYARYKGREYEATVVETKEGQRIELPDGRQFKSLSAAGLAVNDGVACNGWQFWSLTKSEGRAAPAKAEPKSTKAAPKKAPMKAGAKKPAKKANGKAARAASRASYGCGACGETFGTQKAAVGHALAHTS